MGIEKAGISQVVSEQWAYNLFRCPLLRNYLMDMYQLGAFYSLLEAYWSNKYNKTT